MLTALSAFGGDATLMWSANSESDLGGYYVYYKNSTDSLSLTKNRFTEKLNIGNTTSYTKTGLGPGIHSFALTAYDTSFNESGLSGVVTKIVLSSDPGTGDPGTGSGSGSGASGSDVSNIQLGKMTAHSAALHWETNVPATSWVKYWPSANPGIVLSTFFNDVFQPNHQQILIDLIPETPYTFEAISTDASGNTSRKVGTFTTLTAPNVPDKEPPEDIKRFMAHEANQQVTLSWTGPPDNDYEGVIIRYRTDHSPKDINDGFLFGDFSGLPDGRMLVTHGGLTNDVTYYYLAAAYDHNGNFQTTAFTQATPRVSFSSNSNALGGCTMVYSRGGRSPSPGDSAGLLILIAMIFLRFIRRGWQQRGVFSRKPFS